VNTEIYGADVEPGDPHNDQMAARVRDDLDWHVASASKPLAEGASEVDATALIAMAFIDNEAMYPHDRLASLLAVALVRLAKGDQS
jgi:hypothetical protein